MNTRGRGFGHRNPFTILPLRPQGQTENTLKSPYFEDTTRQVTRQIKPHTNTTIRDVSSSSRESSLDPNYQQRNPSNKSPQQLQFKYEVLKCKGCKRLHGFQNQTIHDSTFCSPKCLDDYSHLDYLPPLDANSEMWFRMGQLSVLKGPFNSIPPQMLQRQFSQNGNSPNGSQGGGSPNMNRCDNDGRNPNFGNNSGGRFDDNWKRYSDCDNSQNNNIRPNNSTCAKLIPDARQVPISEGGIKEETQKASQVQINDSKQMKDSNIGLFGRKKPKPKGYHQEPPLGLRSKVEQDDESDWDNHSAKDEPSSTYICKEKTYKDLTIAKVVSNEQCKIVPETSTKESFKVKEVQPVAGPSHRREMPSLNAPSTSRNFKINFSTPESPKKKNSFKGATLLNVSQSILKSNPKEEKFRYPDIPFGEPLKVAVSYSEIGNPPLIFIHVLDLEDECFKLISDVTTRICEGKITRIKQPQRGMLCVIPLDDDYYTRGEILSMKQEPADDNGVTEFKAIVSSADFGQILHNMVTAEIFDLPIEYVNVPRFSIPLDVRHFAYRSLEDLIEIIEAKPIYIVGVTSDGKAIVTNSVQVTEECAEGTGRHLLMYNELKISNTFKNGNLVTIEHVYDFQQFYIRCELDFDKMEEMRMKIMNLYTRKKLEPFNDVPKEGLILLGEHNDTVINKKSIERIRVDKVNGNVVQVLYIDSGEIKDIPKSRLFYPTKDILGFPKFGLKVKLWNVPSQATYNRYRAKTTKEFLVVTNSILKFSLVSDKLEDDCEVELFVLGIDKNKSLNKILIVQYHSLQVQMIKENSEKAETEAKLKSFKQEDNNEKLKEFPIDDELPQVDEKGNFKGENCQI